MRVNQTEFNFCLELERGEGQTHHAKKKSQIMLASPQNCIAQAYHQKKNGSACICVETYTFLCAALLLGELVVVCVDGLHQAPVVGLRERK